MLEQKVVTEVGEEIIPLQSLHHGFQSGLILENTQDTVPLREIILDAWSSQFKCSDVLFQLSKDSFRVLPVVNLTAVEILIFSLFE